MDADPWADTPAAPAPAAAAAPASPSKSQESLSSPAKAEDDGDISALAGSPFASPTKLATSLPASPVKSNGSPSKPTSKSPFAAFDFDDDSGDIGAQMSPPLVPVRSASPVKAASPARSASPVRSPVPASPTSPASAAKSPAKAIAEPVSPVKPTPVDLIGSGFGAGGGSGAGAGHESEDEDEDGPDPYAAPIPAPAFDDAFDDTSFAPADVSSSSTVPSFGDDEDVFATPGAEPIKLAPALSPPAPSSGFGLAPPSGFNDAFDDADDGFNDVPLEGATDAAFDGGDDGFGDFDDFDAAPAASFEDDGFGDFDDFQEGEAVLEPEPAPVPAPFVQAPVVDWIALSLRPVPPAGELLSRIATVLEPLVPSMENFTDEAPRAVGGLAQVLATESTRDTYAQLTTAPILKPLDWTRSRVRRDHLISMGVPVNLDEVDSHRLSTLPPLQITTSFPRSQSVDPERLQRGGGAPPPPTAAADNGPASAGPAVGGAESERKYGLGVRPPLNTARAEELCGLDEDQLALLPLAKLEALHADLAQQTADASALLAWLVQLKDAQTQDSATYNGMISELIANAAKVKTGSTGGGLFRRNSAKPANKSRPASMSASATPRRVGSPGVF